MQNGSEFQFIAIDTIHESATNPRRTDGEGERLGQPLGDALYGSCVPPDRTCRRRLHPEQALCELKSVIESR